MSLARRLAHRASASPDAGPAREARRGSSPGGVEVSSATRPPRGVGFVCEVIEVPVADGAPRPAGLDRDLRGITLPRAERLAEALAAVGRLPAGGLCPRRPAVMFDLETTGLLGQAGALLCVAGAAWHVAADRVRVQQWSLHRMSAEAALLADLHATLDRLVGPRHALVTFNGGSFDLPLLRRRLVRHGLVRPTDHPLRAPHVDLLPPARRLWRDRGPDCRLGTLEARQLALTREGDVGGAEVAELLWRWLEDPGGASAADLARVERHNRIDVLSLAALAATMHRRLQDPIDDVERLRAGRHYTQLERPERALALLAPLVARLEGTRAGGRGSELAVEAALVVAGLERRRGQLARAARCWAQVCRRVPGHPTAHEALAKHLEHRARHPAEALAVAAASVTPCERRLARLRRKAGQAVIPSVESVVDAWARGGV